MRVRKMVAVGLAGAMLVLVGACQPDARPGRGCAPEGDFGIGSGWDQANTYQCRGGRWEWAMTTRDAALAIQAAQQAAQQPPPPEPAPTPTTAPAMEEWGRIATLPVPIPGVAPPGPYVGWGVYCMWGGIPRVSIRAEITRIVDVIQLEGFSPESFSVVIEYRATVPVSWYEEDMGWVNQTRLEWTANGIPQPTIGTATC